MTRTSLRAKASSLAQRKTALGIEGQDYVAQNSGSARTAAKRALLRRIKREAQKRGVAPRFKAAIG